MNKPSWWPVNPYPKSVFVMEKSRYAEIVPDPDLRTGLSGLLGRMFWDIASEYIFERVAPLLKASEELANCAHEHIVGAGYTDMEGALENYRSAKEFLEE